MDKDIIEMIVAVSAVCIPLLAITVIAVIKGVKERREQLKELMSDQVPEPIGVGARVMSKRMDLSYRGIKVPEHNIVFIITFLTDSGETVEYAVEKEIYNRVSEHDAGTLVTLNGKFFDFGKGETI